MLCPSCSTPNFDSASRCVRCGANLIEDVKESKPLSTFPEIWSPDMAAGLSIVFTPVFGVILHALNWRRLGEKRRALASWVWAGLMVFIVAGAYGWGLFGVKSYAASESYLRTALFGSLIIWYFAAGRVQSKYVSTKFGSQYIEESWATPVCGALIVLPLVYLLAKQLG